jgi:predicted GNAT family acetyltransferase|tara:strand:- start:200 stop:562 length:363 start_codon:yes stop_codon:yes gene_type:complete
MNHKLELILEHAKEYYDNPRHYKFIDDGYVQYELFNFEGDKAIYITEMFVSKKSRGKGTLKKLAEACWNVAYDDIEIKHGFCRVEKKNRYAGILQAMYKRMGAVLYKFDDDAFYWKWSKV